MTTKKKQKSPQKSSLSWKKTTLFIIGGLFFVILCIILIIWVLWPIRFASLQAVHVERLSFTSAKERISLIQNKERVDGVKPNCFSRAYIHKQPTERAVTMFHGVSACPEQFSKLGQYFYDRGYNVYIPRVPHHGRPDNLEHSKVTTQGLVDFVNESTNITNALGGEKGVIGLSGGGNLGTWAAEYRPEVLRFLALSPFYEPSAKQAPKWQIRPLLVFHGNNIIPDQLNKPDDPQHALSYRALAKYTTVFNNLQQPPQQKGLKKLALIMADDDDQIDQDVALDTALSIVKANNIPLTRYQIPASYGVGHDIVAPDNKKVAQNQDFLYAKYFELYSQ